jgi:glyoxylase-like metal-dependent hydrolase (beta-lactamase superfamily II)
MSIETYRFQVGALQCTVINDGYISNIPVPPFFPFAPAEELEPALRRFGTSLDTMTCACMCLVVDSGEHRILLETGGGRNHPPYGKVHPDYPPVQPDLGTLMDGLAAENIAPESIDTIILSHLHVDHCAGNVDGSGKPLFPNARYCIARGEWEFFMAQEVPEDDHEWEGWAASIRFAQAQCRAIADRVELVDSETEVLPEVRMIPTPGHSVAHCAVEFVSGNERLVCPVDNLAHPLNGERPEWSEQLNEEELPSRQRILKRAEGALVHVFHFAFPGLGRYLPDPTGDNWWCWQPI